MNTRFLVGLLVTVGVFAGAHVYQRAGLVFSSMPHAAGSTFDWFTGMCAVWALFRFQGVPFGRHPEPSPLGDKLADSLYWPLATATVIALPCAVAVRLGYGVLAGLGFGAAAINLTLRWLFWTKGSRSSGYWVPQLTVVTLVVMDLEMMHRCIDTYSAWAWDVKLIVFGIFGPLIWNPTAMVELVTDEMNDLWLFWERALVAAVLLVLSLVAVTQYQAFLVDQATKGAVGDTGKSSQSGR